MELQRTQCEISSAQRFGLVIGAALIASLKSVAAVAGDGNLDPGFGQGGIALYQDTDYMSCRSSLNAVASAKDGSVVAVGTAMESGGPIATVLKVNPRGGISATAVPYFFQYPGRTGRAVVIDPDFGSVYVGADIGNYAGVYKFTSDLALDTTFGEGGVEPLQAGNNTQINDMYLYSGAVYVTGISQSSSGNNYLQILLDQLGYSPTTIGTSVDLISTSIGVYSDFDGIHTMVAGYADHQCFDMGYRPTYSAGSIQFSRDPYDPGDYFNTVGADTNDCYIDTLTMLPDDGQLLGGRVVNQDDTWSAYLQLMNSSGHTTNVARVFKLTPWGDNSIRKILLQKDGKWVVVGYSGVDSSAVPGIWVGRFNGDGSVDATFGSSGSTLIDFDYQDYAYGQALSAALDARGRIVIAGTYWTGASDEGGNDCTEMMLARLQNGNDLIFADGLDDVAYNTPQ
jgi:hypothetical protein